MHFNMSRAFKVGIVVAVLIAIATALIAPTVDLPETALREHQIRLPMSGEHVLGSILAIPTTSLFQTQLLEVTAYATLDVQFLDGARVPSSRVLRC